MGVPHREVLDLTRRVAAEPRLRRDRLLGPDDCLLNHSLTTFHARTRTGHGPAQAPCMRRCCLCSLSGNSNFGSWCHLHTVSQYTSPHSKVSVITIPPQAMLSVVVVIRRATPRGGREQLTAIH